MGKEAGLRLDTRAALLKGGDSGPAVIPGKASSRLLLQAVRHEGDTTVVTLVEEVVVVEKRLRATEEIRITKRRSVRHEPQQVTLRREEAVVERLQPARKDDDSR